jgi:hypothetical protein
MKYTLQVVITTDDGQTETRELASLEREYLSPTTLGLTLAEGKTLLKALQAIVVERQLTAYLATQRPCAHCGTLQHSKGYHTTYHAGPDRLWDHPGPQPASPPLPLSTPGDQDIQPTGRAAPGTDHAGVIVSRDEVGGVGVLWRHRAALTRCATDR